MKTNEKRVRDLSQKADERVLNLGWRKIMQRLLDNEHVAPAEHYGTRLDAKRLLKLTGKPRDAS